MYGGLFDYQAPGNSSRQESLQEFHLYYYLVMDIAAKIKICIRLLELYKVGDHIGVSDIGDFKAFKSQLYGFMNVYSFDYKNHRYYVTDDYSLMDDPKFIKNVLADAIPKLNGKPLKNPTPQSDGAVFACGLDGNEYYLWESI